ncbi:hypothetical protein M8818_001310 [Zalaria obscura]|uniref:Uncharacterized protein n=1 Tax=Zalaria obscura TaxID=2024903 RepID=A0ACC3SKT9_9PEZI
MATSKSRAHDKILEITSRRKDARPQPARNLRTRGIPDVYNEMLSEAASSAEDAPERPLKRRRVGGARLPLDSDSSSRNGKAPEVVSESEDQNVPALPQQTTIDSEESDEDDFDWEQVGVDQEVAGPSLVQEADSDIADVSVEVGNKQTPKKSVNKRKPATAAEKLFRVTTHTAHVLFLLFHCHVRNNWCNSGAVQTKLRGVLSARTISMLHPDTDMIQFGRSESFINGLKLAVDLWQAKFKVTASGMRRPQWAETAEDIQDQIASIREEIDAVDKRDFIDAAKSLRGSQDMGNQLFCALLRSVGVEARLVCSLQPLPFATAGAKTATPQKLAKPTIYMNTDGEQTGASSAEEGSLTGSASDTPKTIAPRRRRRIGQPAFNQAMAIAGTSKPPRTPAKATKLPKRVQKLDYPIFWIEAFNSAYQKWIPLDATVTGTVARPAKLEPPASYPLASLTYAIAFEADGVACDVTRRYAKAYNAKTRKMRVEATDDGAVWYKKAMKVFRRRGWLDRDQVEDAELSKIEAREGLPGNVMDFKEHPYYALERHLRRHEVIWPRREVGKVSAGKNPKAKGASLESVFRRSDVHPVRSAEKWYRFGREIKAGEQPLKRVPARSRRGMGMDEMEDDEEAAMTPLYASFQTEPYIPPPVIGGRVPKNVYGNLDVYVPSMVPDGGVHIRHPAAAKAAKLIGVDYADAVTGFQFKGRHGTAVTAGVVVAREHQEAIEAVIEGFAYMAENEEERLRSVESLRLWKRFLIGLRIAERIGLHPAQEGEAGQSEESTDSKKLKQQIDEAEDEGDEIAEAGGFFPDAGGEYVAVPTAGRFRSAHQDAAPPAREEAEYLGPVEEDAPRLRRRRPQLQSDVEEDDDDDEDEYAEQDDDEDKDEDEEDSYLPPSKRKQPRRRLLDPEEDLILEPEPTPSRYDGLSTNAQDALENETSNAAGTSHADSFESGGGFLPEDEEDELAGRGGGIVPEESEVSHKTADDLGGGFIPDETIEQQEIINDEAPLDPDPADSGESSLTDELDQDDMQYGHEIHHPPPLRDKVALEPTETVPPPEAGVEATEGPTEHTDEMEVEGSDSDFDNQSLLSHDPEDDDAEPEWLS